jgi:hypothetical protein
MPFPAEHSARLRDPSAFDPKSFRRVNAKFGAGIDVIFGKLKGGKGTMVIQTIRFDAKKFTPEQVRTWLKDHKYSASVEAASGEAKKESITKSEQDGSHPSSHYLVVIDPAKPTTWHLRYRNKAGAIDRGLLGAAWAALHKGFRGNAYAGPNKAEAIAKLTKLYHGEGLKTPDETATKKELTASIAMATAAPFIYHQQPGELVITTKDGRDRWTLFSSSGFRDRDDEIVSTKALLADVNRADHDGDYGPLRFWHLVTKGKSGRSIGADIGDCDFNMVHGHILIESGTFRSPEIAQTVKENAPKLEVSIGFIHPAAEPDPDGVYYRIRRFERSIVPKGRVANRTTRLIL